MEHAFQYYYTYFGWERKKKGNDGENNKKKFVEKYEKYIFLP